MRPLTLLSLLPAALGASSDDWRSRSIYQVMVDRFAPTAGTPSCNTQDRKYCGGTWKGLAANLDYIQAMGFSAIWISPIHAGLPDNTDYGYGYTGYWVQRLDRLNHNFGTDDELRALVENVHKRGPLLLFYTNPPGMYIMIDIVVNNVAAKGPASSIDYSVFEPFNNIKYYHPQCWINWSNQTSAEDCWMGDNSVPLPDINTELDQVETVLYDYIKNITSFYSFDGIRLDAGKSIRKPFWKEFCHSAGVYCIGEVYYGNSELLCDYQGPMDGMLDFATYFPLIRAFTNSDGSISELTTMINDMRSKCKDTTVLGTFSENHDLPRLAGSINDTSLQHNVIAFTVLYDGIPVIYQGQEQSFTGKADPDNREALWTLGFNVSAPAYKLLSTLNSLRSNAAKSNNTFLTSVSTILDVASTHVLAWRKGDVIVVLNNLGQENLQGVVVPSGMPPSTKLLDVVGCTQISVDTDGTIKTDLTNGEPRVYYPSSIAKDFCQQSTPITPSTSQTPSLGSTTRSAASNRRVPYITILSTLIFLALF
ncbi:Alpha-amylase A type-3 [Neolecta irregularis DAH-3]|uniref:alpha-amylase n=1 Tax=Neolecta irregularis (strain DAH-3) TaxID=1198029 RepID=A0A1U7LKD6_NEOID|nr:Alpha-amylase A type-3 [Neolecta irregularis DAH-3]|eukprot:OLL23115.1 Alpha-amylase A type-3 [Neolecta irregularis DAH-3]